MARGYLIRVDGPYHYKERDSVENQQQNVSSMFMTYFDSS